MNISAYASTLIIPPFPSPAARTNNVQPPASDAGSNAKQPQQSAAAPDSILPSTGLLNTVV